MNRTGKIWRLWLSHLILNVSRRGGHWIAPESAMRGSVSPIFASFGTLPYASQCTRSRSAATASPEDLRQFCGTLTHLSVRHAACFAKESGVAHRQIADMEETFEHELGPPSRGPWRVSMMRTWLVRPRGFLQDRNIACRRVALSAGFSLVTALTTVSRMRIWSSCSSRWRQRSRSYPAGLRPPVPGRRPTLGRGPDVASLASPAVLPDALSSPPMETERVVHIGGRCHGSTSRHPRRGERPQAPRDERDIRAVCRDAICYRDHRRPAVRIGARSDPRPGVCRTPVVASGERA